MDLTVPEAAKRLGVSRQRVLALITRKELSARRVGSAWILDSANVDMRARESSKGRPMAARSAWALLDLLQGGDAPWMRADERSRLRGKLRRHPDIAEVAGWCRRRSELLWLRGHSAAVPRLLAFPGARPTGASAGGHDVVDIGRVEVYLTSDDTDKAIRELALRPVTRSEANALIRVPHGQWPFYENVGRAVVALDLWESGDERSRRTARQIHGQLLNIHFPQRSGGAA
ncbi:excisionase family DNA binding protein [Streptacidiphilus sp. MAP12-20]|uniref:helix-turn-helix domain-containing protein n=1 Tax=Streptacidiphilus sp. MAP12-20 TaxID=3156299 RepID=UPI00351762E8